LDFKAARQKNESKKQFTLKEVKKIIRAALLMLPSKELDPTYFYTDTKGYIDLALQPSDYIAKKKDIRYCPIGLFTAVVSGKPQSMYAMDCLNDKSAYYLKNLETLAFDTDKRYESMSLPAKRKLIYQTVLNAA
jgi:hypothetical protein